MPAVVYVKRNQEEEEIYRKKYREWLEMLHTDRREKGEQKLKHRHPDWAQLLNHVKEKTIDMLLEDPEPREETSGAPSMLKKRSKSTSEKAAQSHSAMPSLIADSQEINLRRYKKLKHQTDYQIPEHLSSHFRDIEDAGSNNRPLAIRATQIQSETTDPSEFSRLKHEYSSKHFLVGHRHIEGFDPRGFNAIAVVKGVEKDNVVTEPKQIGLYGFPDPPNGKTLENPNGILHLVNRTGPWARNLSPKSNRYLERISGRDSEPKEIFQIDDLPSEFNRMTDDDTRELENSETYQAQHTGTKHIFDDQRVPTEHQEISIIKENHDESIDFEGE